MELGGWGDDDPLAGHKPPSAGVLQLSGHDNHAHHDITSYIAGKTNPVPLRQVKPVVRAYGYRPPRLHELREERNRFRQMDPDNPRVDENGVVHSGKKVRAPIVVASPWDTRAPKPSKSSTSKNSSVFRPPPPQQAASRKRSGQPATKIPPKGQSLFDDEVDALAATELSEAIPLASPSKSANLPYLAHCIVDYTTPERRSASPHTTTASGPSPADNTESPANSDVVSQFERDIAGARTQLDNLNGQISTIVDQRMSAQQQGRDVKHHLLTLAAQLEKARLSFRVEERAMQQLFQKHRTSSKLVTEIDHKDKLIKEATKMLKAVAARVSRLELPAQPLNVLAPSKQRLRDVANDRSALQRDVVQLKARRDGCRGEIDKLMASFQTFERLAYRQEQTQRDELLRKSRSIEAKAVGAIDGEMDRLNSAFLALKEQREQTTQDEINGLRRAGERQMREAAKKEGDGDNKGVSQLMINVKLLHIEEDTLRKQVADKRQYLYSLREKELELAARLNSLKEAASSSRVSVVPAVVVPSVGGPDSALLQEAKEVKGAINAMREKAGELAGEKSRIQQSTDDASSNSGALEELGQKRRKFVAEFQGLRQSRSTADSRFAKELEGLKTNGLALDRAIERATSDIADQKDCFMIASGHNTNVLEKLDVVERLMAMYNL